MLKKGCNKETLDKEEKNNTLIIYFGSLVICVRLSCLPCAERKLYATQKLHVTFVHNKTNTKQKQKKSGRYGKGVTSLQNIYRENESIKLNKLDEKFFGFLFLFGKVPFMKCRFMHVRNEYEHGKVRKRVRK